MMKTVVVLLAFLLSAFPICTARGQPILGIYNGPLIDVHEHFNWSSASFAKVWGSTDEAISQMDRAGIVKMVVFAWLGQINVVKKYRERLIPFISITGAASPDDPRALDLIKRALDSGFVGIGELCFRHDRVGDVAADNPVAKQIADLAAERNILINVRQATGTRKYGSETIPEFERLISHNRKAKFIWAHAGTDSPSTLSELLARHPNLYTDLSSRTQKYPAPHHRSVADENGVLYSEWREAFEKFPDRFMFGTDMMEDFPVDFLATETAYFRKALGQLPLDIAENIGYASFQKAARLGQPTSLSISASVNSTTVGTPVKVSGILSPAMKDITIAVI